MAVWNPEANELFLRAVDIRSPAERRAYLDQACGGNAELRAQVEGLLEASARAGSFLESAAPDVLATAAEQTEDRPGTVLGPYKLLEQVGEGGMGAVFMAEQQQPVRRKVALKVIKPGMDTRQVVARFEAERQALALMDHPNIARVLDGGATASGRPYFVMELVKGVPITDFCDQNHLSVRERLELFVSVCRAVQHAHQKGVIHRDLKPSNVLVTLHDGTPVPKVIDFGVAKAIGQPLTDKTLFTGFAQMIGTPLYMSPEQAGLSGLDVDTRSDVYSLGVLLYELLTGTTPFTRERFQRAGYDELRRIIREEEPPRPSTRISTLGQAGATVSANRRSDPKRLSRLFRGELDWVVMRALEKDRNRRYETASAFAADVERYLHDEPVLACPPSVAYRLRKFLWRHPAGAALFAVSVAALLAVGAAVAGLVYNSQLREEKADAQRARGEAERAQAGEAWQRGLVDRLLYFSDVQLAQRRWEAGEYGRMRELLTDLGKSRGEQADLPGFEYYFLRRQSGLRHTLRGHRDRVTGVSWSPDGKRLASAAGRVDAARKDGEVKVWDAASGKEILSLRGHTDLVQDVCWSPDGQRLAGACNDKTVRIWDGESGKEVLQLKGHTGSVSGVSWGPDGKRLGSASRDGTVRIWDTASGKEALCLRGHTGAVMCVSWSPDGQRLASGGGGHLAEQKRIYGEVKVWDAASGKEALTLKGHPNYVWSVCWSPDGRRLAGADGAVKVWDVETGKEVLSLQGLAVSWSPDGQRLAGTFQDGTVRVFEASSGREVLSLKGHTHAVHCVSWSPDGQRLASGSEDKTVRVWDAAVSEKAAVSLGGGTERVTGVSWSPGGRRLASAHGLERRVQVWDAESGKEVLSLRGHTGEVLCVSWSPDGKRLASAGRGWAQGKPFAVPYGELKVWDAQTGKEVLTLKGHSAAVSGVSWSPDGERLASAGGWSDKTVRVWDVQTGKEALSLRGHTNGVSGVSWSPDGRRLAGAGGWLDNRVRVWDVGTGKETLTLKGHTDVVTGVAWSPDGQRLASASNDTTVKVWDVQTGQEILTLKGHSAAVSGVSWSPDGERLASAGGWPDKTVRVWDVQTGKEALSLRGLTSGVMGVSWSPDGQRLASASGTEVKIWDGRPLR
jgi:WD40 repeat protein/serine/threonine protein kinase